MEYLSRNTVASMTSIFCLTLLLVATEAAPAPMTFKNISTGGNHCCWWTAAEGEITDDTPREFERIFKTLSSPIRFNSPGGSLFAALELGSLIRKSGFDTEVGRTNGEDKLNSMVFVLPLARMHLWAAWDGTSKTMQSWEFTDFTVKPR